MPTRFFGHAGSHGVEAARVQAHRRDDSYRRTICRRTKRRKRTRGGTNAIIQQPFQSSAGSTRCHRVFVPGFAAYDFVSIDYPGAAITSVGGINNAGTVVGGAGDADGNPIAVFTYNSKKGTFTTLTPAPGSLATAAGGINEPGEIVGSTFDGVTTRGYVRSKKGAYTTSRTQVRARPLPGRTTTTGWSPDTMSTTPPTPSIRSFTIPATTRSSTSSRTSTASTLPRASTTKARSSAMFFWMRACLRWLYSRAVMDGCAIQVEPFHFSGLMVRAPLLAASPTPASSPASSIPAPGHPQVRYPADGRGLVRGDYNPRRSIAGGRPGGIGNHSGRHQRRRHCLRGLECR